MTSEITSDNAVTVMIGENVRPGCEKAYVSWQQDVNSAASRYPGFIAAEINSPTSVQPHWSVIYRFDSIANLRTWINSATRQERLAERGRYCDGPATQEILMGGAGPPDALVTTVVTHRVAPEHVDEFLSWQERLRLAENKLPGYRGSEIFRPVEGVQDEWTTLYRYDSAADLDRWLTSTERVQLLEEGRKFSDFRLRTIDSSFGNWFTFDDGIGQARTRSNAKTAIAVWFGLYPTAMLLGLALSPAKLPMWQGTLIGTLSSSFVMTCVTMPFYVNRSLRHRLQPTPGAPKAANNIRAALLITSAMACWALLFWLLTTVFWKLP